MTVTSAIRLGRLPALAGAVAALALLTACTPTPSGPRVSPSSSARSPSAPSGTPGAGASGGSAPSSTAAAPGSGSVDDAGSGGGSAGSGGGSAGSGGGSGSGLVPFIDSSQWDPATGTLRVTAFYPAVATGECVLDATGPGGAAAHATNTGQPGPQSTDCGEFEMHKPPLVDGRWQLTVTFRPDGGSSTRSAPVGVTIGG